MAAVILEERPEDQEDDNQEQTTQVTEEAVEEQSNPPEPQDTDDDIPEKYRGKSAKELARMHQEAEKLLGRQSSEVGELRKVVDSYIQTQLSTQAPQQEQEDDDVDFFVDPDKAVARAIERHPKIRQAEEVTQQYKKQNALSQLQQKHPDMQQILGDPKFAEWVKGSNVRTRLFVEADQQYDYEAANELFDMWKDRQGVVNQTLAVEKQERKQQVKAASTGNARGNPDGQVRKIYRRADIIKLMKTDPDRYMAMSDEIMQAYQEGRVKS